MSALGRARQDAHLQYAYLLQWNYLNAMLEDTIKLQDEYMSKVFYTVSKKLSDLQEELEETKLIAGLQEQIFRIIEAVQAQSQALFHDIEPESVFRSGSSSGELSSFQLDSKTKTSLKTFETLAQSLNALRSALKINLSKIPCKEVEFNSAEVLKSLMELNATLAQIVPESDVLANPLDPASVKKLKESAGLKLVTDSASVLCESVRKEADSIVETRDQLIEVNKAALDLASHIAQQVDNV